jgi:putative colanic acid biosynthesis glycosyltransferase WcaI
MARRRLLVLNQYYWPGIEATAHLLTDLCEALAEDYDVTVVTGRLRGHEELPVRESRNGVEIIRVPSLALDRAPLPRRAANYATYLFLAAAAAMRTARPSAVLCMTDPPMIGDIAWLAARRFRAPLVVISEDVFPEIAVELQRLQHSFFVGVLGALTRFYLRRADRIVAIGDTMKERLVAKGADGAQIRVIPNWVDTKAIEPRGRDNDWARDQELEGRFVVMHSGNVGHAQDLDNLVRATTFLRDLDDLTVLIVGFGARHAEVCDLAARLDSDAVRFLAYQPRELLAQSLSSADVHFLGLASGLSGFVVPSRLYGILAAGRPVLVAADPDSETARVVESVGCGLVVSPGRPELVATAVRELRARRDELDEMGRRGRAYVEAEADRLVAVDRYRSVLAEVVR